MAEATVETGGRYVEIAVDTPDNIQSFGLVKEIDTSQLTLPSGSSFVSTSISQVQNCRIIHGRLQSTAITQNESILGKMFFVRKQKPQYTLVTEGSTYNCPITTDEFCGALNRHFEPVEMGEKPIDWDENKRWKYWEKIQTGTFTDRPYYRIAREPWSATTQYYSNTQDFHYYYIIDGDKKVRIGVGDTGLTHDNHRMGMQIGHKEAGDGDYSGFNDAFWTFINGDTEQIIKAGTTSNEYYNSQVSTTEVNAMSNMFAGAQMNRYLFNTGYNTGWRSSVTDEQKGQWRTRVHNDVRIKNVTTTQFGFLNHDGHRYFGIWVCYPTAEFYVGYKQYESASDNPISTATSLADLRSYNYDNPIPDTEMVKWGNVYFYGVELDALEVTLEEKEGTKPPDINQDPTQSTGWTPLRPTLPTQRNLGTLAGANESGFHVWCLARPQFQGLVGSLWQWGTFKESYESQVQRNGSIYNPLTNPEGTASFNAVLQDWISKGKIDPLAAIQTCMALPKFITPQVLAESNFGQVRVAGVETGQFGYCCEHETYIADFTVDCKDTAVTSSYLDMAPNTSAEIYLPYIGTVGLDPASFIGGQIDIRYSCCVVDGTISATVWCTSSMAEANLTQYGPYLGSASHRIPIAQKDANAFQRELGYVKAVGTAVTGAVSAVIGSSKQIAKTLAHTVNDTAMDVEQAVLTPQIIHGGELGSGSAIVCATGDIQVQLSTPLPKHNNEADLKEYGMTSGEIGSIESFGNGSNGRYVSYSYAKLDKIPATAAEIEDIKSILYGGVYQ